MPALADPQTKVHITPALSLAWTLDPEKFVREVIKPPRISNQQIEGLEAYKRILIPRLKRLEAQELGIAHELTPEEMTLSKKYGISIQSGQGTGKDAWVSWVILHFLTFMPRCKINCTGPTAEQLKNVLWSEIYKWMVPTWLTEILVHQSDKVFMKAHQGKIWFASWKTVNAKAGVEEQAVALAGKHEDRMLNVVEEASGVPDGVFRPIEGSMTQLCNLTILIFNPTRLSGYAIESQTKDRSRWECLHWDAEESDLVDPEQNALKAEKYGRDSNFYRIRVRGLPPRAETDALIPWEWAMEAVKAEREPLDDDVMVAGLDVSGPGTDQTVLCYGRGPKVYPLEKTRNLKNYQIAEWVAGLYFDHDIEHVAVDVNGIGYGVAETLENFGISVLWVNVGCSAEWEPDRFERLRDELWFLAREEFQKHAPSIPDDDELIEQLTAIKYEEFRGLQGKTKVEGKQELRDRGFHSPDSADAYCLRLYAKKLAGKRRFRRVRPRDSNRVTDWRAA